MTALARAPPAELPISMISWAILPRSPRNARRASSTRCAMSSGTIMAGLRVWAMARLEFKSAHRATADIHETLQRRDLFGPSSMPSQVLIDERVAEFVRERVSQEAGQTVKSVLSQSRKTESPLGLQRHEQRR